MACATAKKDGSSRYANSIRARSTRLAGSVRERAIAPNSAKSVSPIANSIACRHAVMSSTLSANQSRKPRTHVGKWESSTYDGFHGIDVLDLCWIESAAVLSHVCFQKRSAQRRQTMLTNLKIALAVALVLATASAALAAPKHPVRHQTAVERQVPASALLSFGSARSTGSVNQPLYITIQDIG